MNTRIEQDSIYDNQSQKVIKNRIVGTLPTKLQSTNLPVTFHKKIKSSGYSSAPGSLKYTSKQKQKAKEQKTQSQQWTVSQDFHSKPLPIGMPPEVQVLNEKPISKASVTKVKFSPLGTKLACASVDNIIGVIKTPLYQNNLEVSTLYGHNGNVTSISWSSNDQYLLSSSADKTCIVWNLNWQKKGEKLLVLDKQIKTKQGNAVASSSSANQSFSEVIRHSQFFY